MQARAGCLLRTMRALKRTASDFKEFIDFWFSSTFTVGTSASPCWNHVATSITVTAILKALNFSSLVSLS